MPSNLLLEDRRAQDAGAHHHPLGAASMAMAYVTTPTMFYVLRFILGVVEAGFFPAWCRI